MRTAYKIILSKDDGGGYLVTVPDFECHTQGEDIAEAMYMARDVIGLMGITMEDMGKKIPEPDTNTYTFELADDDMVLYVDVDFLDYRKRNENKKVKKTLTIPSWLNEKAEDEQINFSRLLEEALLSKLHLGSRQS